MNMSLSRFWEMVKDRDAVCGVTKSQTWLSDWTELNWTELTRWTFVGKVMSLLLYILFRLVIAFLPRSKHLLISWLESLSTVILEPKKMKSVTVSIFFSHLFAMKWWDWMPWSQFFKCWVSSQSFYSPLSLSSRGSLVPLCFLPSEWYHPHVWGGWYFSGKSWFQLVIHPAKHFTWCTLHIS